MPRPPPNLLLCFDAFGTLFTPKRPVPLQYAEVARQCGLTSFSDHDLESAFKRAFKSESKRNPNYGRATGLGATQWWTNVINKTFTPLVAHGQPLPTDLTPRLLHRFSSKEAYDAESDLVSSIRSLKQSHFSRHFSSIVTGVITNSDDRVPDILSSLGLNVSPLRYGTEGEPSVADVYDIDFHCMSYHVGVEKPDRQIFRAAEWMLEKVIAGREDETDARQGMKTSRWLKVYVGDELKKDVEGASNAGWSPILFDPSDKSSTVTRIEDITESTISQAAQRSWELTTQQRVGLRTQSIRNLALWLTDSSS